MAFTEVRCSRCRHAGFVCVGALPAMLRCSHCNSVEFFRDGRQTIRAHCIEDDAAAWGQYEAGRRAPPTVDDAKEQQKPRRARKLAQPRRIRKKRQLTPRVVETV